MSKINFQPLSNFVLVLPEAKQEVTKSGLYIPETSADRPNKGKIVAVGLGAMTERGEIIPMKVKYGDAVIFPKFAGTELQLEDTKYLVMRETDLFGKIE